MQRANDSEFGLAGAVISADEARCKRVAEALQVGIVWVNCSQPCFCQVRSCEGVNVGGCELQEAPGSHVAPGAPGAPWAPLPLRAPVAPEALGAPWAPGALGAPGAHGASGALRAPGAHGAPRAPVAPEALVACAPPGAT